MNEKEENQFFLNLFEFHRHLEQMRRSHWMCMFFLNCLRLSKIISLWIWSPHPLNNWLFHLDIKIEAFKGHFYPLQTLLFDCIEIVWIYRDKYNVDKVPLPLQEECQHKSCQQQASSSFYIPTTNRMQKFMSHIES